MSAFVRELGTRPLICDGAMGTMLHSAGNSLDRALPELNLSNPDLVSTIHHSYLSSGTDIVLTNTFGASSLRLTGSALSDRVREINLAGARLARMARESATRAVFIAGSVSPAVTAGQRQRVNPAERRDAIREQVNALAEGGVDLLAFETFGYLDELVEAVTVAAEHTEIPVLAQATFTAEGRTLSGETPAEVVRALTALPIAALGANCTVGPQKMLALVSELRQETTLPISAQPNAGLPRRVDGRRFEFHIDGDYFARYTQRYVESGAAIVGGCCGITPAHIEAAAARLPRHEPEPEPAEPAAQRAQAPPATSPSADQSGLVERFTERRFVLAAEIVAPSGGSAQVAVDRASSLHELGLDVFFVSSQQDSRAPVSTLPLALHLRQAVGTTAFASATTWDRTIMTLQPGLLGAHALGTRTVVCETSNPPVRGDYPNVDGIWEVDSVGLIELLAGLNAGRDCNGVSMDTKTEFHIGARFNPGARDTDAEIARTKAKRAAGADFFITRSVYELDGLRRVIEALSDDPVPILLAVSPLRSFQQAEYLAHEVPGVTMPAATLSAMERAGDQAPYVGLELATELLEDVRTLADGVVLRAPEHDTSAIHQLLRAI